jgi:hypothetical protein
MFAETGTGITTLQHGLFLACRDLTDISTISNNKITYYHLNGLNYKLSFYTIK